MDIFTIIFTTLYSFVCLMWGTYSVEMQKKVHPAAQGTLRQIGVFVINSILCPLCISIATIKLSIDSIHPPEYREWYSRKYEE